MFEFGTVENRGKKPGAKKPGAKKVHKRHGK